MTQGREEILAILRRAGLVDLGVTPEMRPLPGGVSSDIWHVTVAGQCYCVKRALAKLKVQADWRVTTQRSYYEAGWMQVAELLAPGCTPKVVHVDMAAAAIVMHYLNPSDHRLWKDELLAGRADPDFAASVGKTLAAIHCGTANVGAVRAFFATDQIFREIRIEPYLIATSKAHPNLATRLRAVARETLAVKRALVHGDVSPKNILIGPKGPVFLDAECAWYGDPAFDLAFCLNHMLLKAANRPQECEAFMASFASLATDYLSHANFEQKTDLERRTASLLPCLFLARVDGKSPVEYLNDERIKGKIRQVAQRFIQSPAKTLNPIADAWAEALKDE